MVVPAGGTVPRVTTIVDRVPSVSEYLALRRAVGWRVPDEVDVERALLQTTSVVLAEHEDELVGMGRLVGDGTFYLFVVDLVVRPEHQGRGIGSQLLTALEERASEIAANGTIQLVADSVVGSFYEKRNYVLSTSTLLVKRLA